MPDAQWNACLSSVDTLQCPPAMQQMMHDARHYQNLVDRLFIPLHAVQSLLTVLPFLTFLPNSPEEAPNNLFFLLNIPLRKPVVLPIAVRIPFLMGLADRCNPRHHFLLRDQVIDPL